MLNRLSNQFRHSLDLTPRETWRLLRARLPGLRGGAAWTPADLLNSAKHRHGIRFAELLLRQEAVVRCHMPWEPLSFEGARVLEIGCGPLGGYGPLAIFCGAKSFESVEPEWDLDLFFDEEVASRYFRIMHADLSALYGPRMNLDNFLEALRERINVHKGAFDTAPIEGKADIVLSQSCLEHVFPLEPTIARLAELQSPSARFLHLVDFGNHYLSGNPFDGLYEQPPADYIARRGKAINMHRASDVERMFGEAGIAARVVPSRVVRGGYAGTIHPWWHERYDNDTLFTQLVLVAGPAR